MGELNKNVYICKLIDCYGELLKQSQLQLLKDYYFDDFSLSELASINGITRQAISESLNLSLGKLEKYEQKLHHVQIMEIVDAMDEQNFQQSKKTLKNLL